jgi:hypothetical protein
MSISFHWDDSEFKKFQKKLKDISGEHDIPIKDLMTDSFIRQHSKFDTFQALLDASGIKNADEIGNDAFSKFVSTHTTFGSWHELKVAAGREYVTRKLGH